MTIHCFFEQSGTFKNEFKKLGYKSFDYDILNEYNETDYIINLFLEIERAYANEPGTVFDRIGENDLIMAFFPCTMFQENNFLFFSGKANQMQTMSDIKKLEYCIKRHKSLSLFYDLFGKLFLIAYDRKLKMIVENPATTPNYLLTFFPVAPTITDKNRMDRGDYYKKPTNYWFINCELKNNIIFEMTDFKQQKTINHIKGKNRQRERSEISSDYANRFIREFIL